jgi:hypothetical protein
MTLNYNQAGVELAKHGSVFLKELFLDIHNVHVVLGVERFNRLRPGEDTFL